MPAREHKLDVAVDRLALACCVMQDVNRPAQKYSEHHVHQSLSSLPTR